MKNNRGAVLPTVITLLFITTFLLLSHSWTTKQQVVQLHMFQDSYRLKAMLILAENHLRTHVKKESLPETIAFEFSDGAVHAAYTSPITYELTGTLTNGISATKSLEFPELTTPEEVEETKLTNEKADPENSTEEDASQEDTLNTTSEVEDDPAEIGEEVSKEPDIMVEPPASHSSLEVFDSPDISH